MIIIILRTINLEEQYTYFNEKHIGGDDSPLFSRARQGAKYRLENGQLFFWE